MPDTDEIENDSGEAVIPTSDEGTVEDLPPAGEEPVTTTTVEEDTPGGVVGVVPEGGN